MPIKSVKMKISKNIFLQNTDTQTDRVNTEGTLSGFQDFSLPLIIKDRPNWVALTVG